MSKQSCYAAVSGSVTSLAALLNRSSEERRFLFANLGRFLKYNQIDKEFRGAGVTWCNSCFEPSSFRQDLSSRITHFLQHAYAVKQLHINEADSHAMLKHDATWHNFGVAHVTKSPAEQDQVQLFDLLLLGFFRWSKLHHETIWKIWKINDRGRTPNDNYDSQVGLGRSLYVVNCSWHDTRRACRRAT